MRQKSLRPDIVTMCRARIPYSEEYYDMLAYEAGRDGNFRLRPKQQLQHVTVNKYGYRGKSWSGQETILLLGDSVKFGVRAASDEVTFARFLETSIGQQV